MTIIIGVLLALLVAALLVWRAEAHALRKVLDQFCERLANAECDRNELAAEVWSMRAATYGKDRADEYLALYGLKMVDGRIRE